VNNDPSTDLAVLQQRTADLLEMSLVRWNSHHDDHQAIALATQVRSVEIERRLTELNHAARKAAEDKLAFLTIAAFEQFQKSYEQFLRDYREAHQILVTGLFSALPKIDYESRHSDLVSKIGEALPRTAFEQAQEELMTWRDGVAQTLSQAKGSAIVLAAIFGIASSIAGGLIVGILVHLWK